MRILALTFFAFAVMSVGSVQAKECPPSYKLVNGYCVPE